MAWTLPHLHTISVVSWNRRVIFTLQLHLKTTIFLQVYSYSYMTLFFPNKIWTSYYLPPYIAISPSDVILCISPLSCFIQQLKSNAELLPYNMTRQLPVTISLDQSAAVNFPKLNCKFNILP